MEDQIVIHSFVQPFLPRVKIAYPFYLARSSTEPTASALQWLFGAKIGKRRSVTGWRKTEKRRRICACSGGPAKEPTGRIWRIRKKSKAGHGDRGIGIRGIGPKKTGRDRPVHGAAVIHRRQSPRLSLPPDHARWLYWIARTPNETTEKI